MAFLNTDLSTMNNEAAKLQEREYTVLQLQPADEKVQQTAFIVISKIQGSLMCTGRLNQATCQGLIKELESQGYHRA